MRTIILLFVVACINVATIFYTLSYNKNNEWCSSEIQILRDQIFDIWSKEFQNE